MPLIVKLVRKIDADLANSFEQLTQRKDFAIFNRSRLSLI